MFSTVAYMTDMSMAVSVQAEPILSGKATVAALTTLTNKSV